jgi:cytochrome d ubiquinol oxidase subunit II
LLLTATFVLAGVFIQNMDGYLVTSVIDTLADSDPLNKEVAVQAGAWMSNFDKYPLLWIAPGLGVVLPILAVLSARFSKGGFAFLFASLANGGVIFTAGVAMFPFVMPSSIMPGHSLTMWDSTSSELTLVIMTVIAVVMVPTILGYTAWCYYKMFGRLNDKFIEDNNSSLY